MESIRSLTLGFLDIMEIVVFRCIHKKEVLVELRIEEVVWIFSSIRFSISNSVCCVFIVYTINLKENLHKDSFLLYSGSLHIEQKAMLLR